MYYHWGRKSMMEADKPSFTTRTIWRYGFFGTVGDSAAEISATKFYGTLVANPAGNSSANLKTTQLETFFEARDRSF